MTADGTTIMATLPAGEYELRHEADRVLVVRAATGDGSKLPNRAELEPADRESVRRVATAGGART